MLTGLKGTGLASCGTPRKWLVSVDREHREDWPVVRRDRFVKHPNRPRHEHVGRPEEDVIDLPVRTACGKGGQRFGCWRVQARQQGRERFAFGHRIQVAAEDQRPRATRSRRPRT